MSYTRRLALKRAGWVLGSCVLMLLAALAGDALLASAASARWIPTIGYSVVMYLLMDLYGALKRKVGP